MSSDGTEVVLEDGAVLLRPFGPGDIDAYLSRQDAVMAAGFEWEGPATAEDLRAACDRWAASWRAGGPQRNFAIVAADTGELIGDCEIEARADGFLNVMYAVFSPWRGRGVASRAGRLLLAYAATEFPGLTPLFRVHPTNGPSLAVARRLGARPAGRELSAKGRELTRLTISGPAPIA